MRDNSASPDGNLVEEWSFCHNAIAGEMEVRHPHDVQSGAPLGSRSAPARMRAAVKRPAQCDAGWSFG
jgi:hypothetical protein